MKWLVLAIFGTASLTSLLWSESKERKFTAPQRTALATIALTGWALVLVLGSVML